MHGSGRREVWGVVSGEGGGELRFVYYYSFFLDWRKSGLTLSITTLGSALEGYLSSFPDMNERV